MAFKEITSLDCEVATQLGGVNKKSGKKNPTQIEGYFLGSRTLTNLKYKGGSDKLHVFQTENGNIGVFGKTNLDPQLAQVAPGTMTRVSFTGMVQTPNNPMYKYKVEVDSDNTIEVSAPSETQVSAETESSYEDESEEDAYEDESEVNPVASVAKGAKKNVAVPSAATIQDLLKSRKSAS